jgi:hypothetical protein
MERAIVEVLKLEPGDNFLFSLKENAIGQAPEGRVVPVFLPATFKAFIYEEGKAVLLMDLSAPDGVLHVAIDVDTICKIGKTSSIKSPSALQ